MDLYQYHNYENTSEANLPPGFRFHPTDEELITYYLLRKVLDSNFNGRAITEIDLNKCEPWELPGKAKMGEKEWYFYSLRDRKYPTGLRTNRATEAGYWKATGKDREIYSSKTCALVGMKKTLVFYKGRAPKGEKSNWVMHEYRLEGKFAYHFLSRSSKDEWVISRVFQKSGTSGGATESGSKKRLSTIMNHHYPEVGSPSSVSLPPLLDSSPYTTTATSTDNLDTNSKEHVPCFSMTTITPSFNATSMFDNTLPPSATTLNDFLDPFSSSSVRMSRNNYGASNGFPSLKSLQENLQLNNFLFPTMGTPPMHGGGSGGGGHHLGGGFGPFGNNNWPGMDNRKGGSSEFDCLWS
ncbi:hypothetical protein Leryth_023019 [Lithospermum erythrorhizon]|uniref:NAC domain-containing protein n=1 Tax=Lithospermum erythrorhizon TaxID=34254 RepID=A0AAV3RRI0_LITER|nr:hypothetical protein Leryth_023019 [Lithospermum erythrorhizon]